jgi:hypothetical protein
MNCYHSWYALRYYEYVSPDARVLSGCNQHSRRLSLAGLRTLMFTATTVTLAGLSALAFAVTQHSAGYSM